MSEMVERIARAIYPHIRQAYVDCCQEEGVPMELTPGIGFADEAFVAARAAIAAMREPTKAMIATGNTKLEDCTDSGYDSNAEGERFDYTTVSSDAPFHIWQAMIDAALAENGQ